MAVIGILKNNVILLYTVEHALFSTCDSSPYDAATRIRIMIRDIIHIHKMVTRGTFKGERSEKAWRVQHDKHGKFHYFVKIDYIYI
jgi:hypothetical protein